MQNYIEIDESFLRQMYVDEKLTIRHMANLIGCSYSLIRARFKEFNIMANLNQAGESNPNWAGGKIKRICIKCGKEFWIKPSVIKAGRGHFHNLDCYLKTIKNRAIVECEACGVDIDVPASKSKTVRFCSMKCKNKWQSNTSTGENNPNWRGGPSFEPYEIEFNEKLKERIRKRDNYVCQFCGIKQANLNNYHKKLGVHHIDYNKQNNGDQDFISLCCSCHCKTNYNRDKWSFLFDTLNEIRLTK